LGKYGSGHCLIRRGSTEKTLEKLSVRTVCLTTRVRNGQVRNVATWAVL